MAKIHSVVVGLGEIGSALFDVLSERYEVLGVDKDKPPRLSSPEKDMRELPGKCDFLNICIPYSNDFVNIVNQYIADYLPLVTIVHSTVPVGTTNRLDGDAVHSPVNGKHPDIKKGLKTYTKFVGSDNEQAGCLAKAYLSNVMRIHLVDHSSTTELMKILCLCRYGIYLYVADEMARICKIYGQKYEEAVELWEREYNEGIGQLDPDKRRPVYAPPGGKIGGHCVLQVMEMAKNAGMDSEIIKKVLDKYIRSGGL